MLSPEQLKKLSEISTVRPLIDIFFCWTLIISVLALCNKVSYMFIPVALLIIASRCHALGILMHEGSHFLLNKNRAVNDLISNLFCSFPLQISTQAYRTTHNSHHRHTQTMKDPNYKIMQTNDGWNFPKNSNEVTNIFIKDLFLLNIPEHMLILKDWQIIPNFKKVSSLEKLLYPIFLIIVASSIYITGAWKEFLIFQLGTLLINPLARMRAMSEHIHKEASGQDKYSKLKETTTINANFIERFFFSPMNTNRHLEHHLFPSIPYYNLEKVHSIIKKSEDYQKFCRYELDGYFLGKRTSFKELLSLNENSNLKAA